MEDKIASLFSRSRRRFMYFLLSLFDCFCGFARGPRSRARRKNNLQKTNRKCRWPERDLIKALEDMELDKSSRTDLLPLQK